MARRRKKGGPVMAQLKYEFYGILILIFSIIALSREGAVARSLMYLFRFFVGVLDWVIPVVFIYIGLHVMIKRAWPDRWSPRKTGLLLLFFGFLIMNHITMFEKLDPNGEWLSASWIVSQTWSSLIGGLQPEGAEILTNQVGGGLVGALLYACLFFLFNDTGAKLIQYTLFLIGFALVTGFSYVSLGGKIRRIFKGSGARMRQRMKQFYYLLFGPPQPKAKKQPVPVDPYIPEEDEFDEPFDSPAVIREKRKPVFFQWLHRHDSENKRGDAEAGSADTSDFKNESPLQDEDGNRPVIRDFLAEASKEREPAEPAPSEPIGRGRFSGGASSRSNAAHSQMKIRLSEPPVAEANDAPELNTDPAEPAKPYELPPFHLLAKPSGGSKSGDPTDYKAVARKLETTLESFGVRAKVLEVVRGPTVTRYEIQPDVGVKVSRIVSLTDDIALALAAKDIRMEAPIPGKSAIGIEVPNTEVSVVTLREVMESPVFLESESKLTIALGRDISGQAIVGNLARMPHLLVAGATGSGKSVCINGIIASILYKAKPDEVKFLMIDPKMVELNVYNGIPHLVAPVVTDPRRASLALKKVVHEMEKRYELFSKNGTRNIEGYNAIMAAKEGGTPLPYIVVIVDELADLMMVAANDVEDSICRLAQMARAAGIHLIIATQRPSVDVITGVIKANIPSRIAFGVSSQVDSRTILDMAGAEKLLGRGDMLFLPVGASKPIRVQGAFLSDQEVEAIVQFVRNQGQARYQEELVPEVEEPEETGDVFEDELYEQAVQIVLEAKQASVSLLQRRMRIGYTRAARLIDAMEAKGIVGPYEGSKPREVLVSYEDYMQNRISS